MGTMSQIVNGSVNGNVDPIYLIWEIYSALFKISSLSKSPAIEPLTEDLDH